MATVPATLSFGTGATTVSVPVTGVAAGSVDHYGKRTEHGNRDRQLDRHTTGGARDGLPGNITLAPGGTATFPVTLGTATPAGGVVHYAERAVIRWQRLMSIDILRFARHDDGFA